jgi:hypothetical protein
MCNTVYGVHTVHVVVKSKGMAIETSLIAGRYICGSYHLLSPLKTISRIQNYWVFGLCPSSSTLKTENITFWKLNLFPSLHEDGDNRNPKE